MRIEVTYIEDPEPKKRFKLRAPKIRIARPTAAVAAVVAAKPAKPAKPAKKPKPIKPPKAPKPKPTKKPSKPPKPIQSAKPLKKKPVRPKKPTKPIVTDEPRRRLPRAVRNVLISAGVLLVLSVGVGEVYVMLADSGSEPTVAASMQPAASSISNGAITPSKPSPKAPEGVAVELATSPVTPGAPASVSIHTNPGSTCTIAVVYNYDYEKKQTPVSDPNLSPQTADDFGSVNWNWTISQAAPVGPGRATVVCTYHGRSAMVVADVVVTK